MDYRSRQQVVQGLLFEPVEFCTHWYRYTLVEGFEICRSLTRAPPRTSPCGTNLYFISSTLYAAFHFQLISLSMYDGQLRVAVITGIRGSIVMLDRPKVNRSSCGRSERGRRQEQTEYKRGRAR